MSEISFSYSLGFSSKHRQLNKHICNNSFCTRYEFEYNFVLLLFLSMGSHALLQLYNLIIAYSLSTILSQFVIHS